MWKHIRRVVVGGGAVGGATFWLSTNSIPETITKANGVIWTNLKWLGWQNPPSALASTAADHTGVIVGLILMGMAGLVLLLWGAERLFGDKEVARVPTILREFIFRNIHHKELFAQSKAEASLGLVVHRASEVTAWQPLCEAIRYLVYETQWAEGQPVPANKDQFDARVGLEIRERFARGDVRARGKLGFATESLDRATEVIPVEFWTDAFLQPHGEIVLCDPNRGVATLKGGGTCYRAIVVAQNDVELTWPRRSSNDNNLTSLAHFVEPLRAKIAAEQNQQSVIQRDTTLAEGLAYAEFRQWGKSFFDAAASAKNQANEQLERFRQLAHDGALTVWGKRRESGVFETIPVDHWKDHNVEWFDLLRGNARTENVAHSPPSPFLAIMVSKAEFEREWPHA